MKKISVIKNVTICDVVEGTLKSHQNIVIENDIIKDICSTPVKNESFDIIDAHDMYAIPGLWECHCHLGSLTATKESFRKEVLEECDAAGKDWDQFVDNQLKSFTEHGITSIRDVGGPLLDLERLAKLTATSAHYPTIHYAGPMLEKSPLHWEKFNEDTPGFTVAIDTEEDAQKMIDDLVLHDAALVKTFNKFDPDIYAYLVNLATERNLPVTHDPGTPLYHHIPMDMAIDLGVRCFEHGKAPWPAVLVDSLKQKHDTLLQNKNAAKEKELLAYEIFSTAVDSIDTHKLDALIEKMEQANVFFCPTIHVTQMRVDDHNREENISEEKKELYAMYQNMTDVSKFLTMEIAKHHLPILVGHDGFNPDFTWAEMTLLDNCGLTPVEIIRGATLYPAQWFGYNQSGSLSIGNKADIVLLQENPFEDVRAVQSIRMVFHNGIAVC